MKNNVAEIKESETVQSESINTVVEGGSSSASALILDPGSFGQIEKLANLMASGKSTIPEHLRNPGDCMAIIMQSMQWSMNPWSVAQKTHLIKGVLGYEAQLVAAVINSSGAISSRFKFEFIGPWENVIGKFEIKTGNNGEYRVPGWKLEDEEGIGVRIQATVRGESEPDVLEVLLAQARVRNSSLWADDPKQQLAYLAQKKWARLYAPDVIMGVYSTDELEEKPLKEINPAPVGSSLIDEKKEDLLPAYEQKAFAKRLSKYVDMMNDGKSADEIINTLKAKFTLSEDQEKEIRSFENKGDANAEA